MIDNFEEVRSSARAKRARAFKPVLSDAAGGFEGPEPASVAIEADIAAVTLVEQPVPEPVVIPEPVAVAAATQEETTMATTAETITETTNAAMSKGAQVFADMNGHAKSAADRGTALMGEMNGFTKGNVDALVESGRIAVRGYEQMGREAADYARRSFETMTANMRELASVKSPTELMKLQAEQTRSAFDQAVAQTSHTTEAALKLAGEIAQPISNRFAIVADRMKTAA